MNHLIVLLHHDSPSFCHYAPADTKTADVGLMPLDVLRRVVEFSVRRRVPLNFIYGERQLPTSHEALVEQSDHVKFVPFAYPRRHENAVIVVNAATDMGRLDKLAEGIANNVILRISRHELGSLAAIFQRLLGGFARLNIVLGDLEAFDDAAVALYTSQLSIIEEMVAQHFRKGEIFEVSNVTDRLFLINMNNCNAGIDHFTIAPNGKLYLCPAFYLNCAGANLGELDGALEVAQNRLLDLKQAPICRNCDAYQCKRCVWLNKRLTLEFNTPSRQQCLAAHTERNASRDLVARLGSGFFEDGHAPEIPQIDYLDPLDVINDQTCTPMQKQGYFAGLVAKPLQTVPVQDLLMQIHSVDPSMLAQLKSFNQDRLTPRISPQNEADCGEV
ncbi:MAG: CXXX repeat peptide maturase [Beijerinckiaceae bacterium]